MMSYEIAVENIKCGGCANTITSKLSTLDYIENSQVDIENGLITINGDETHKDEVVQLLLKLGYPECGAAEGLKAVKAKAKSFVSCAVGRIKESH